jgi:hypothetical protein
MILNYKTKITTTQHTSVINIQVREQEKKRNKVDNKTETCYNT